MHGLGNFKVAIEAHEDEAEKLNYRPSVVDASCGSPDLWTVHPLNSPPYYALIKTRSPGRMTTSRLAMECANCSAVPSPFILVFHADTSLIRYR